MESSNRFLLHIYDGAQHCMPSEFNEFALTEFKKIVHFDSAGVANFGVNANNQVGIQSLHLHSVSIERFADRTRTVGSESMGRNGVLKSRDSAATNAFAQRGKSVIVDIAQRFTSPDILRYCRKYETAHSLSLISATAMNSTVPGIALWRASRRNPYLEQHGADATLLLPHLFQAMSINRRLATGATRTADNSTAALASLDGNLFFVEPETIRLLQLEWKEWTPPMLPPALMEALGRSKEQMYAGRSIQIHASVREKMICLRIAAINRPDHGLTAAELRTAQLAARGLPYKEIARECGVSPATVRNQLHSVYRKLSISNKTALAAWMKS